MPSEENMGGPTSPEEPKPKAEAPAPEDAGEAERPAKSVERKYRIVTRAGAAYTFLVPAPSVADFWTSIVMHGRWMTPMICIPVDAIDHIIDETTAEGPGGGERENVFSFIKSIAREP